MSEVFNIFAHQIYVADYPDFHEIQEELTAEVRKDLGKIIAVDKDALDAHDKEHVHPCRGGTYGIMYDVLNFENPDNPENIKSPALRKLHDWMTEQCKEYWKVLEYSDLLHPYILQMWGLEQGPEGFTASHNHAGMPVAGAFYIDADSSQGNLVLEDPSDLILSRAPYNKKRGTPKRFNHEVDIKPGRLVLFPGWMRHYSKINFTDRNRVLMAINYGCYGQVYYTDWG